MMTILNDFSKQFVIDVSCGDYHSCVINNQREVYIWGSNKDGQLGLDYENCPSTGKALKVILNEYMNSSNKERFVSAKAKANYTVLICETKNVMLFLTKSFCSRFT
jgi:alpha-tubulin suppressor-like RCC1 family protein